MISQVNPDQDTALLVVVSVNGGICGVKYFAKQSLVSFKELPTWNTSIEGKPSNYNPRRLTTQFILTKLGTPDRRSVEQQIGQFKKVGGTFIPPEASFEEWVCAQVLSHTHDRVGSLSGVSFSYSDSEKKFQACYNDENQKFIVVK